MDDEDPDALRSMLKYFYTGRLSVPMDNILILGGPATPSIDVLLKVYKLACKYKLPDLKQLATEQYCEVLSEEWPKGHGMLVAKCLAETFSEDLEEPEGLRDATLDVAVRFSEELLSDEVVYDMLYGEPLRALTLRLSRGRHADKSCHGSEGVISARRGLTAPSQMCRTTALDHPRPQSCRSSDSRFRQWR